MATNSGLGYLELHPFVRQTTIDRLRGTIFGAALGDTIGLYTEFLSRDLSLATYPEKKFQLVEPTTELRNDGHRNKFNKTSWTDDTDHALLILLSYLHTNGRSLHQNDLAIRLRFWCDQGLRCLNRMPFGLGRTVGRVVFDENFLEDPIATAYRHWRASNFTAAANGSLMRTYPLGIICLDKQMDTTFQIATDFSRITHADPRCIVSCCLVTGLIRGLLRGEVLVEADIDKMAEESFAWVQNWIANENKSQVNLEDDSTAPLLTYPGIDSDDFNHYVRARNFEELQLDDGLKMGYVYKAMGAGILTLRMAMRRTICPTASDKTFEELITTLVLYGGDADTNAAVAGSLLGAFTGFNTLPGNWKHGLMHFQWLFEKCDALASVCNILFSSMMYEGSEDPDTRIDGGKRPLTKEELDQRERAFVDAYMRKSMQTAGGRKPDSNWFGTLFGR